MHKITIISFFIAIIIAESFHFCHIMIRFFVIEFIKSESTIINENNLARGFAG